MYKVQSFKVHKSKRQYEKLLTDCRRLYAERWGVPVEASWFRVESRWQEDCGKTLNPLICLQHLVHQGHQQIRAKAVVCVRVGTGDKLEPGYVKRDCPGSISAVSA